jgi:hypothetical protein
MLALASAFGLTACQALAAPGTRAHLSTATRPPAAAARPPAQSILDDGAVGARRDGGRDHLSAAEFARDQPDQVAALRVFTTWGWVDAATRSWPETSEILVVSQRPEDAGRAFDFWTLQATQAGLKQAACPAGASPLQQCSAAVSDARAVLVGRAGASVFRLDCPRTEADRLASAQARALA